MDTHEFLLGLFIYKAWIRDAKHDSTRMSHSHKARHK
jgi:hypothetical protein